MANERQINSERSPWWGEHLQRYQVVEKAIGIEDSVLDLACGSGYGASILSRRTKGKVTGGDVSAETVRRCSQEWNSQPNLEFKVLDGTRLEFPDNTFDKVVSFETIEHTREFEKMLSEFNRVLKPGGIIFLSTPNITVNSPGGLVTNPYHTQEFDFTQFSGIVKKYFSSPAFFGQKYIRYSGSVKPKVRFAHLAENLFYRRMVRKLPIGLRDSVMRILIGKPLYPLPDDYSLVSEEPEIRKCKTLFAICKKI